MKQNITIEQFREISPKAQDEWFSMFPGFPEVQESFHINRMVIDYNDDARLAPTIGQMIEFLDKYHKGGEWFHFIYGIERPLKIPHTYTIDEIVRLLHIMKHPGKPKELCDCLWEEVKKILNKSHPFINS